MKEKIEIDKNLNIDPMFEVIGNNVVITNFVIENEQLANLLFNKKKTEEQIQLLTTIISQGTNLITTFKGTVEIDWAKESLSTQAESLNKKFKSFENKLVKNLNEVSSTSIKNLKVEKEDLLNSVSEVLNQFIDEDNKKSVINILTKTLNGSGESLLDNISESTNKKNKEVLSSFQDQLAEFKSEVLNYMLKINEKLDSEKGKEELIDRTTLKGVPHEDYVQKTLSQISLVTGDIVHRTGSTKGTKGNKGDHLLELNKNSSDTSELSVVFESKTQEYKTLTGIKKYLNESMANRSANVGIMVFDKVERYSKISDLPFYVIDNNKAICALTKDNDGELALKLAYSWARAQAAFIDQQKYSQESIDINQLNLIVQEALSNLKLTQAIQRNHDSAISEIEKASLKVNEFRNAFKQNLKSISELTA